MTMPEGISATITDDRVFLHAEPPMTDQELAAAVLEAIPAERVKATSGNAKHAVLLTVSLADAEAAGFVDGDTPEEADHEPTVVPDPDNPTLPEAPPRHGKGSGTDRWIDYGRSLGLELSQDADRADVLAAVDAEEARVAAERAVADTGAGADSASTTTPGE